MTREILTLTLCQATWRRPDIRRTLLATHFNGQPLTVDHGAPLRLLAPVKLGLKNVKAITKLTYVAQEPRDYWAERGYSHYDGIANRRFCRNRPAGAPDERHPAAFQTKYSGQYRLRHRCSAGTALPGAARTARGIPGSGQVH